jgi:plastocyanin
VRYLRHHKPLAVVDDTLSGAAAAPVMAAGEANARATAGAAAPARADASSSKPGSAQIGIDNFAFTPRELAVRPGQTVSWINHDDVPHRIQSATGAFAPSAVLDTKGTYALTLPAVGEYPYFCSLHPTMTGKILVR